MIAGPDEGTAVSPQVGTLEVRCAALECGARFQTTVPEPEGWGYSPKAWRSALDEAQKAGWSTFEIGKRAHPQKVVHCPACTAKRAEQKETCRYCVHGGLYDFIGHDEHGHRIANSLRRSGIETVTQLRECSNEDLHRVRGLGARWVTRIRSALEEAQDDPDGEP